MDGANLNVSVTTLIWTGVIGVILLVLRQTVLAFFNAKNTVVAANAQDNVIERLQKEITRLENIIIAQNTRISELEYKLSIVVITEIEDADDVGEISNIFETICIGHCDNGKWLRVQEAIARLKERRKARHSVHMQSFPE